MPTEPAPFRFDQLAAIEQRHQLSTQRGAFLYSERGPVARFERRGNPLYELAHIAGLLAGKVPYAVVVTRFVASVKAGWFGWRKHADGHRVVFDLVDTVNYDGPWPRAMYLLRPTLLTVEANPAAMRARKSRWRRWIEAMGWEVPFELLPPAVLRTEAEAKAAFMLLVDDEYETTGKPGNRAQHRAWAKQQGPFHVTDAMIDAWRRLALVTIERKGMRRK